MALQTQAGRLTLRYLFGVHYECGQEYFQTQDDISTEDPKRSAYFDVCQRSADGSLLVDADNTAVARADVQLFQLINENGDRYLVDLRDGHFEVNGAAFFLEIPPPDVKLALIYFRRRRHHFQGGREIGQECEYHFGWRYCVDGKLHQCTLTLV